MEPWLIGLIIGLAALVVIAIVVIVIINVRKNQKIRKSEEEANQKVADTASGLSLCLGGNENIVSIEQRRSRVVIAVKDISKVNKEEISKYLDSVMYMSNKITCVIGSKSEEFTRLLNENISKAQ